MKSIQLTDTFKNNALIDEETYQSMYQQSITEPDTFWGEQANQFLDFTSPFTQVFNGDFKHPQWFIGGQLNVSEQCIDRHLASKGNDVAIIWEGDEPNQSKSMTYHELHREVCRMSDVLKQCGVKKGTRVAIYLPMIIEAAVAMLACARIGAIHTVVFSGFSANALSDRLNDANCHCLISTNQYNRGGKTTQLHQQALMAVEKSPSIKQVLWIDDKGIPPFDKSVSWPERRQTASTETNAELMEATDPLFILYTSGSTGKPKGILHSTAGYLLYATITHRYVFNYQPGDIFWAMADVGWVTGHNYIVYGPLANGATTLMYAGLPTYPNPGRVWSIIDKHQVNHFYTAPTVIRALMREGTKWLTHTSRQSLKWLGSVGEPINPDVWLWYYNVVGNSEVPVCDTWWQTETGGVMLAPFPGTPELKPGFAQRPFFGIEPVLLDEQGTPTKSSGMLAIKQPWPGLAQTIYGDPTRFDTYFMNNLYISGDEALIDASGNIQIIGRLDDVLNVSGHRIGSAEVENVLCEHFDVAEAAVVGVKHAIKGEAIYAFVTLKRDSVPSDHIKTELIDLISQHIGRIAKPEVIQWSLELPKTRSGKIMRRLLRKIANGENDSFGDLSTLAKPQVIDDLIREYQSMELPVL